MFREADTVKIRNHTFRGLRYRVEIEEKMQGFAEVPGPARPREIYVDPEMPPREFLYVAIHEAMHAEDSDVPEQVIERRAHSMSRWLWRLGYRRED
jgi:hypothetical protein